MTTPFEALETFRNQLREAQPWIGQVQRALIGPRSADVPLSSGLMASDYAGYHRESNFVSYAYLIVDSQTHGWDMARRTARLLAGIQNRRVAYKGFRTSARSVDLYAWLDATKFLKGHLVVFAFSKQFARTLPKISPSKGQVELRAKWKDQALEDATRKALLGSLMIARYLSGYGAVNWYSDEDDAVANDMASDDFRKLASNLVATFSPQLPTHFGFGTTERDCVHLYREDICSIPDLAAGMASQILSRMTPSRWTVGRNGMVRHLNLDALDSRTEVIASWFWGSCHSLEKTLISIDFGPCGNPDVFQVEFD